MYKYSVVLHSTHYLILRVLVSSIAGHRSLHCAVQGDSDNYYVYNGFDNVKVDEISENIGGGNK